MSSSMRCRKGVIGRMIFMRRLLACMGRIKAASRDSHAADAGVIVGQRAQLGPDELYEVERVWEEGVLPERSERFSASEDMAHVRYFRRYTGKAGRDACPGMPRVWGRPDGAPAGGRGALSHPSTPADPDHERCD